jgi:hypothetical protein
LKKLDPYLFCRFVFILIFGGKFNATRGTLRG